MAMIKMLRTTSNMMIYYVLAFTLSASGDSHELDSQPLYDHLSYKIQTECPLWFYYNSTSHKCQDLPYRQFNYEGNNTFIESFQILTCSTENRSLVSIIASKNYQSLRGYNSTKLKPGYILLPKNISILNEYMCGPLNRKGYLCSECSDGFGPSMILTTYTDVCYNCTELWYGMTLYLFLEFVPITVFYILILVFQVSVTSAPMTCFIMYSQLTIIAFRTSWDGCLLCRVQFTEAGSLRVVSKVILTLYGVFNLDFFRHIAHPFCISSHLKPIHIALLGYVSAFYPILLIVLTWLCVELHGRNFQLVVCLWKPFHRCFVQLKRGWNTKSDITDVFASIFLLSYGKILYQTSIILSLHEIFTYSLAGDHQSHNYALCTGVSIRFGSAKCVAIAVIAGLIFCVFNLLPVLLLVLYPSKMFRTVLSKCRLDGIVLNIFVEKFHCCYRDGLNGGRDMRSFSGLYFLLMVMVFLIVLVVKNIIRYTFEPYFLRGTVFSVTALLIASCRPYRKTYMNLSDTLLLFYLATFCYILSSDSKSKFFLPFMSTLILIPFAVFSFLIVVRVVCGICRLHTLKPLLTGKRGGILKTDVSLAAQQQQQIQPISTYGTLNNC